MQNIFYGLRLFSNTLNSCLLPLFSMSLGCVNYALASCTLACHDYEVLHACHFPRGAAQSPMKDLFFEFILCETFPRPLSFGSNF